MKFYILIISLFFLLSLIGCNSKPDSKIISKELKHQLAVLRNDSIYAILENGADFTFQENVTYSNLSEEEIFIIDSILIRSIHEYNDHQKERLNKWKIKNPKINEDYYLIHEEDYRYQLIPVINSNGEKIVWINSFCKSYEHNDLKEVVFVMDGGNCFFNLKINLKTKKSFNFMVNGVA